MTSKHALPRSLMAAAVATAGLLSTPIVGHAQTRVAVIEEIIVTARKTEESIQDTPISIQAFGSHDLEQIGAFEADAIANLTPNLRMQRVSSSQDNFAYSIRGVAAGDPVLSEEPTVGLYMDGVYIARSAGAAFDIADLERIEVLRGPQGTLFGRNTIGGAINIITEKPRGEFAFKQLLSFGDYGYRRSQTTIDTPQIGDFAFKLSHMAMEKEGWQRSSLNGGRLGDRESEAFRLAARWTPTDDVTIDYTFDRSERESNASREQISHVRDVHIGLGGGAYQQAAAFASQKPQRRIPIESTNPRDTFSDIDGHALNVEWYASPELTIKSITSYREWKSGARSGSFGAVQGDGTIFDFDASLAGLMAGDPDFLTPIPMGENVAMFDATRRSAQRQFTQEFQFVGTTLEDRLFYNVGVYYFEEKANERNPQEFIIPTALLLQSPNLAPLAPAFEAALGGIGFPSDPMMGTGLGSSMLVRSPNFAYATNNQSWALYGQFTYSINYDLDVTLGLRYTWDKKKTQLTQNFDDLGGNLATLKADESWQKFSPSLTVDYRWTPDISTYAKVATGYRSGGFNTRASTTTSFLSPVDEENLISYELGLKSDWLDRTLRVNAAVFYMDYEDRQVAQLEAGSGGASTRILNAGESRTRGLELDVTWVPLPGLRLMAGYGYLDTKFKEFITERVDPVTAFPVDPTAGNEDVSDVVATNLMAPKHSASLSAEYSFEPFSFGTLSLRMDGSYTSSFVYNPQLTLYDGTDSHYLVNARATLADIPAGRDGFLRVALWGKNLENKRYKEYGIEMGVLGYAVNTWNEPRSFGVDIVYEYNR